MGNTQGNDFDWQDARRLAAAAEVADFFPADYNEREIIAIAERALAGADGAVAVVPRSELDELRAEIERLRAAALAVATREVPGFIKNGRHWQTVDGYLFWDLREALGIDSEGAST